MKTKAQTALEFDAEMTTEEVAAIQTNLEKDELNGTNDEWVQIFFEGHSQSVSKKWRDMYLCPSGSTK